MIKNSQNKRFHFYKVLKRHYEEKVKGIYYDTDFLIASIECEDVYRGLKMQRLVDWVDAPNLNPQHPLYDESHKGKLNFVKREVEEETIAKIISLKPKLYFLLLHSVSEILTGKDIPSNETETATQNVKRNSHE